MDKLQKEMILAGRKDLQAKRAKLIKNLVVDLVGKIEFNKGIYVYNSSLLGRGGFRNPDGLFKDVIEEFFFRRKFKKYDIKRLTNMAVRLAKQQIKGLKNG